MEPPLAANHEHAKGAAAAPDDEFSCTVLGNRVGSPKHISWRRGIGAEFPKLALLVVEHRRQGPSPMAYGISSRSRRVGPATLVRFAPVMEPACFA
jgi:hypothetical protein